VGHVVVWLGVIGGLSGGWEGSGACCEHSW